MALADHDYAYVATPERTIRVGPLDDCRGVAVSPDGQWLATGSHRSRGAQVWRIADVTKVAELPIDYGTRGRLQPRWEMADDRGSLPAGSGKSAPGARCGRSATMAGCFSPDGRLVVVQDASK